MAELTAAQVIRALERLEKGWPPHLMLFASSSNIFLLRKEGYLHQHEQGGVPPSAVLASFSIPADGGDPDFYGREESPHD